MFTGIIEGIGKIKKIEDFQGSKRIWIDSPFSLSREKLGASIAVDGCCLTLTAKNGKSFSADVSPETLGRTSFSRLKSGVRVNLERPLRLSDRLGGHLVQGHVDGVGVIKGARQVQATGHSSRLKNYLFIEIQFPKQLRRYIVEKGSIAIDGISLTVNRLKKDRLELCLIPHTQEVTALTGKKSGDRVNLEVDVMAKYLEQLIKRT